MHGGKSTGPRTAEGRARIAAAKITHGGRSIETRELLSELRRLLTGTRTLLTEAS